MRKKNQRYSAFSQQLCQLRDKFFRICPIHFTDRLDRVLQIIKIYTFSIERRSSNPGLLFPAELGITMGRVVSHFSIGNLERRKMINQ